tara:strand:+ start:1089 stop:1262 length:174 start_codon:yes stop_codon:yes gene_type:complete
MAIEKQREEYYKVVDGVTTLVEVKEVDVEVPTKDEEIASKEDELLALYAELKTLKGE